ncbi:glycosyltransferase family 2 protein [Bacillus cereus]|uniref:glycosyltransferase family 2 protein n=1 Tax=Bacillus cereus TaxID=1396 RepID=UPI003D64FF3C
MLEEREGIFITTTVISHFYNEEYLLPWWLMHHTKLFDHGILINKGSTDRSVEICKQFAPHWEVRNSANPEFDALATDREVMEVEQEVEGWKMILNTTEFLCVQDKETFWESLTNLGGRMYWIEGLIMVEDPNYNYSELIYTIPLMKQRFHGYLPENWRLWRRGRFIHNHEHGSYTVGRHLTAHECTNYPPLACILWFGFSPWNDAIRKRKLQIGSTLSEGSKAAGMGTHHVITPEILEKWYRELAAGTQDLRLSDAYGYAFL